MKREQFEIVLTLVSAWAVYAVCQEDFILPSFGTILIGFTAFKNMRITQPPTVKPVRKLPWINLIGIALMFGLVWRNLFADPPHIAPGTPRVMIIMQPTLVFLSLLIWFHRNYYYRSYALNSLSFSIVAISINVKFDQIASVVFFLFCLLSAGFILVKPHILPASEPCLPAGRKKQKPRNPIVPILYLTLFMAFSFGFFTGLVHFVKVGDRAFMSFIQDYLLIYRHHLLTLSSTLHIQGPGVSGHDIRPILEIDRSNNSFLYLSTQVFEHYDNGIWKEPYQITRGTITNELDPSRATTKLIMFEHLKGVIPSLPSVGAVKFQDYIFEKDENGIIYAPQADALKIILTLEDKNAPTFKISEERKEELTQLTPYLKSELKKRVEPIVSDITNPLSMARTIEAYFKKNFDYSLDIYYTADDRGVLAMLDERRPAYCSYFASVMALMLRERNIPARLRVGFLATETIDDNKKFLVRIRDAHAWVEALLPVPEKENAYLWVRFDPTPAASRLLTLNQGRPLNRLIDWLWRIRGRIRTEVISMDTTDLVINILMVVLMYILLKNSKDLLQNLKDLSRSRLGVKKLDQEETGSCLKIYRAFEEILKKAYGLIRKDTETDEQLVMRLAAQDVASPETVSFIESFLRKYQAVRFGGKTDPNLKDHLKAIEEKVSRGREES